MTEENPWKKQLQMQKNNVESTSGNSGQTLVSTPPWIKKKEDDTGNSSPPWMKKKEEDTSNSSPPWMKKKEEDAPSTAPWMKKQQETPQPAWAKKNGETTAGTASTPPWAKNTSSPAPAWAKTNDPLANKGITAPRFLTPAAKKAQEERIAKEEAERQRLKEQQQARILQEQHQAEQAQKRRIQEKKEQKERQLQIANAARQRQAMQKEQQQSLEREKMQRGQAKKAPKGSKAKKSNKKAQKSPQNQKKQLHRLPENSMLMYLALLGLSVGQQSYTGKIDYQKQVLQLQQHFNQQCGKIIVNYLKEKKIVQRKRRQLHFEAITVQYALCEGRKTEAAMQFDMTQIYELKQKYSLYCELNQTIITLLKRQPSLRLRVPLLSQISYKGIQFLCMATCAELQEAVATECSGYIQVATQIDLLEKQLQLRDSVITKDQIELKKVNFDGQDIYFVVFKDPEGQIISEAKSVNGKSKSSTKSTNSSPSRSPILPIQSTIFPKLTDFKLIQLLQTRPHPFPYYIPNTDITPNNPNIRSMLSLVSAINTIYASCQGQVNEESFFRLVVEQNSELWKLIALAGHTGQTFQDKGIVLAYLEAISCVQFDMDYLNSGFKKKHIVSRIWPNAQGLSFQSFEVVEFSRNFDKYIREDRPELAVQALAVLKELKPSSPTDMKLSKLVAQQQKSPKAEDISKSQIPVFQIQESVSLQPIAQQLQDSFSSVSPVRINSQRVHIDLSLLQAQIKNLVHQRKAPEALQLLKSYQVPQLSLVRISMCLQQLNLQMLLGQEVAMLQSLSSLITKLSYYFSGDTTMHSQAYSIVGLYYSLHKDQQKTIQFYSFAMTIVLKLYGEKSLEIAQVYLARAEAFLNLKNAQLFTKDINCALKIFKGSLKNNAKVAQCSMLMGCMKILQKKTTQGLQLMQSAYLLQVKMENYPIACAIKTEMLQHCVYNDALYEKYIQEILRLALSCNHLKQLKKIINIIINRELRVYPDVTVEQLQELVEEKELEDKSEEEVLVELEESISCFSNMLEVVKWAMTAMLAKASRKEISSEPDRAKSLTAKILYFYEPSSPAEQIIEDGEQHRKKTESSMTPIRLFEDNSP